MSEWISVKDRLPEIKEFDDMVSESVLVCSGRTSMAVAWMSNIFNESGKWASDGDVLSAIGEITHWMPLPVPPK